MRFAAQCKGHGTNPEEIPIPSTGQSTKIADFIDAAVADAVENSCAPPEEYSLPRTFAYLCRNCQLDTLRANVE